MHVTQPILESVVINAMVHQVSLQDQIHKMYILGYHIKLIVKHLKLENASPSGFIQMIPTYKSVKLLSSCICLPTYKTDLSKHQ